MMNPLKYFKSIEKRLEEVEGEVLPKKEESHSTYLGLLYSIPFFGAPYQNSLRSKVEKLRKDFEELDVKFDALERYLQIEFVLGEQSTQTYDWAEKKEIKEYRKCKKTFEEMKKEKNKPSCDCDDED